MEKKTITKGNNVQDLIRGTLEVNSNGYGFVTTSDRTRGDIFIPRNNLGGAVNRDTVMVRVYYEGKEKRGDIVKVLTRGNVNVVGTFIEGKNGVPSSIIPDDIKLGESIRIRRNDDIKGAQHGDKVVLHVTDYGDGQSARFGQVQEVLGHGVGIDILSIIRAHNLYEEFPKNVDAEAQKKAVPVTAEEKARRLDLTNEFIFTIDPDDAKDLDDAVSIKIDKDGNYILGVHIADVSHYVTPESALDKEAFKRGTSVYFPGTVLPMLPRALSNNICSLHPNVDRLCLSVLIKLDKTGQVLEHSIKESVINSKYKLSYDQAQEMLDDKLKIEDNLTLALRRMAGLALQLERRRQERGEVAFDIPEPKIILDKKTGKISDVIEYPHWLSHRIIESFMICANEVVAKQFCDANIPFVYRIHEQPDPIKISALQNMLKPFGISTRFEASKVKGQHLQALLNTVEPSLRTIIAELMLRSMQKAKYLEKNLGHFGLGATDYCHFTSPIRRYPDLAIHRITKLLLNNKLTSENRNNLFPFAQSASKQGSETEKEADLAEQEVDELKKAEFMMEPQNQNKLFEGRISGIAKFGVFVRLPNTVEGLVRLDMLPRDSYNFDETHCTLIGSHFKFRMGDPVKVRVASVNLQARKVSFAHELCRVGKPSFSPGELSDEGCCKQ